MDYRKMIIDMLGKVQSHSTLRWVYKLKEAGKHCPAIPA